MKSSRLFLAALLGASLTASLSAQTARQYPGTKSSLTLTVTVTGSIGAFLIKDSVVNSVPDEDAPEPAQQTTYSALLDPVGYEPSVKAPAHNYQEKTLEKFKTFGTGENATRLQTEYTVDTNTKLSVQKFTNADFIDELIRRGLVPITDPKGYKLVAIQGADTFESPGEQPFLFFIENGASIFYVGRQGFATINRDALTLNLSYERAEARTHQVRRTYAHKTQSEVIDGTSNTIVVVDETGTRTEKESFTGKRAASISILGSYYDAELDSYVGTGVGFYSTGQINYSGKLDATKLDTTFKFYTVTKASFTNGAGSFYGFGPGAGEEGTYYSGLSNAGLTLSATKVIADISPYLNALPEELAAVKEEIIGGYPIFD